ncbi:MAG: sulfatase [Chlorobi bacterium]|nr:sulfatase [Chlorobiota bacterium]
MKKLILVFLVLLFAVSCSVKKTEKKQKLNVLFIAIDDLRPELGCYGNKQIKSPNIDKLASEGVLFTNHYVQVPTCGASRYAMLTGLLPSDRIALSNEACVKKLTHKPESGKPETFIHYLRQNGYYTVGIGKISHYPDGYVYGYLEPKSHVRELPYSWDEMIFDPGKWGTGQNAFFGYADGTNRNELNNLVKPYEKGNVDDTGYVDGLTAELAIRKLKELKNRKQPFFLGVGFFKPHLPFNSPAKYWDMYNEDEIPLAPVRKIPDNVSTLSLHNSGEFNSYKLGDEKASLKGPVSEAYERKLRHAYFACVSYVDAQVGKVLDELKRLGLDKNTIVIVWGDHGWHLGDQLVWGKHTIFERALRSTLIVKVPGANQQGVRNSNIVSTVDIYPTISELCGLPLPDWTDGKSFVPLLRGDVVTWDNKAFSYYRNGISMRTPDFRFTVYFRNNKKVYELYDHRNKDIEDVNVAAWHPEIIEKLLPLWQKGDTGLYGE